MSDRRGARRCHGPGFDSASPGSDRPRGHRDRRGRRVPTLRPRGAAAPGRGRTCCRHPGDLRQPAAQPRAGPRRRPAAAAVRTGSQHVVRRHPQEPTTRPAAVRRLGHLHGRHGCRRGAGDGLRPVPGRRPDVGRRPGTDGCGRGVGHRQPSGSPQAPVDDPRGREPRERRDGADDLPGRVERGRRHVGDLDALARRAGRCRQRRHHRGAGRRLLPAGPAPPAGRPAAGERDHPARTVRPLSRDGAAALERVSRGRRRRTDAQPLAVRGADVRHPAAGDGGVGRGDVRARVPRLRRHRVRAARSCGGRSPTSRIRPGCPARLPCSSLRRSSS